MRKSTKIKVTLRKKAIAGGKKLSLYLDYYPPIYDSAANVELLHLLGHKF